jgi:hypothetical protein
LKKRQKKAGKKRDSSKSPSSSPLPAKAKGKAANDSKQVPEEKKIKKIVDKKDQKGPKTVANPAPSKKP